MSAKTLMIQGTASGVGKSVIVAALCRILVEEGYKVAPFKAQNMALNSFVTPEGGEIGRAQAAQAQACQIDAHVDMNPILMKPFKDTQAQIILLGRAVKNMTIGEYAAYKKIIFPEIVGALRRLQDRFDVVVIEGAGSPAEINLKHQDIVNMKIAEVAGSPVILVGDIDRGGVFASFVGTLELLEPQERDRIAAFLINKFRGDRSLLNSGIEFLANRTGKPTLGIISHYPEMALPEEDGLHRRSKTSTVEDPIRIRVVLLKHLSNFTDFDALMLEPDVDLRFVSSSSECMDADLVILPGSKNTVADLLDIRHRGFFSLLRSAQRKFNVLGICAGFQMLGERILDPHLVESSYQNTSAIGIIPSETNFERDKRTVQVTGTTADHIAKITGYQIHHGRTTCKLSQPWFAIQSNGVSVPEGYADDCSGIYGTSIHGIFDEPEFRRHFLNQIRKNRSLSPLPAQRQDQDWPFQQWANFVRDQIDMKLLMGILEPRK
ncbi:cobyric acid synthase [bacterium]|nr:cobyric acid synthase [bacterium]MCI0606316.1 cobyric acid synthase [bacterium]